MIFLFFFQRWFIDSLVDNKAQLEPILSAVEEVFKNKELMDSISELFSLAEESKTSPCGDSGTGNDDHTDSNDTAELKISVC